MARTIREARQELISGLLDARRHIRDARQRAARDEGLRRGARVFFAMAAVYFLWRVALALLGQPDPLPQGGVVLLLALLVAVIPIPVRIYFAAGQAMALASVAERLDLALGNANRIATALDLSARRVGAFEAAAIVEGVTAVQGARGVTPVLPPRRAVGFPEVVAGYFGVLLGVTGCLIAAGHGRDHASPSLPDHPHVAVATRPPAAPGSSDNVLPQAGPAPRTVLESETGVAPEMTAAEGRARGPAGARGQRVQASGRPGRGKSGEAREAKQSSVSRGDPTEGSTPPEGNAKKKRTLPRKEHRKKPTASRVVGQKKKLGEESGATVGQGGSGGGAMSPVKSPWKQEDRTGDEPLPENPADEDVEDEIDEEEARGGTQPNLRDRKAATSRDLSISGPGEGGEGRGGPTPHKKARGTASMVLGVPVPDFVRGLLNPGTTKVTQERVEPVTSPGKPHAPVSVAGRRGLEPPTAPPHIPPDQRDAVRLFLRALHRAGAKKT